MTIYYGTNTTANNELHFFATDERDCIPADAHDVHVHHNGELLFDKSSGRILSTDESFEYYRSFAARNYEVYSVQIGDDAEFLE